jgi:hypothetical protein
VANNQISIQVTVNTGQAQQQITALNQAIAKTGVTSQASSQATTAGLGQVNVSVTQLSKSFDQLGTAIAGLGIERMVASMIQTSSQLDRITRAMTLFTGSAQVAHDVIEQVAELAKQTPFHFLDLENAARQLAAFGVEADKIPGILQAITSQVAAFGGSIGDVSQMVGLFGRIVAKDFVGAMDLFRQLPRQGVSAMKALEAELSTELGKSIDAEGVKQAIKNGILDPLNTVILVAKEMRRTTGQINFNDAALAFKNLQDEVIKTSIALGDAFAPSLIKMARAVTAVIDEIKNFADYIKQLPESTGDWIVYITAGTVALTALAAALKLISTVGSPLLSLIPALGGALVAVFTNPALLAGIGALTAALMVAYHEIPEVQKAIDGVVGGIKDKVTAIAKEIQDQFKKMFEIPEGGKLLVETEENLKHVADTVEKVSTQAGESLLRSLGGPVEALIVKYAQLLSTLKDLMTERGIAPAHQQTLIDALGQARTAELSGAEFQKQQKVLEEQLKLETEKVKGSADAQIAYIEALDAQDLRHKLAALDQITAIRLQAEEDVYAVQKDRLDKISAAYHAFIEENKAFLLTYLSPGQIDEMTQHFDEQLAAQRALALQKATDAEQKYRLEAWKKANDLIIEDQKRVYSSFRDIFDQIFNALTGKAGTIGQALGNVFKQLALGELRETFSTGLAGLATQAAGYGVPEESLPSRGQGLLGILLRRGMPPRGPMAPPAPYQPDLSNSVLKFDSSTDEFADANKLFRESVGVFNSALFMSLAKTEEAPLPTEMPSGPPGSFFGRFSRNFATPPGAAATPSSSVLGMLDQAAARYGVPPSLLRAMAQAESAFQQGAVSPKGAIGVMQLMPGTARMLGADPYDVQQNIDAGARYMSQQLQRFGSIPLALAAYNAGPGRVAAAGGIPNIPETLAYIARVQAALPSAPELPPELAQSPSAPASADVLNQLYGPVAGPGLPPAPVLLGPTQSQGAGAILTQLLGSVLGPSGSRPGGGAGGILGQILTGGKIGNLGTLFGIGGAGGTSITSVLGSQGAGAVGGILGSLLLSQGLQRRVAPITVAGGALSGLSLGNALGFAPGTGLIGGAGLGLVAAGLQRGGFGGLGMAAGGGALTGAALGFQYGGPMGALIGAGIGAAAGAIAGTVRLFIQTEQERIRSQIKQVYGIDISNRQILAQIQQIVDQTYGGSVSIGIRSQEVQNIVRLYALSTGQAAMLPRPMYSATYIQSQSGGLALQPVYQGGQLVQNPYTGPTTYQYQTAVTTAEGLKAGGSLGVPGATGIQQGLFLQLNAQQAQQLMTGQVVQAIQSNPAAVANATAAASRSGDSRMTTASAMMEPLTVLS